MTLTLDDITKFEELDRQRERVHVQAYTNSNIPTGPDHEKYIEYKRWKQSLSLQPAGAHGNEHTAGQLSSLPLSLVAMARSTIPTQDSNMFLNPWLGAAANVSSKACMARGIVPN